MHKHGGFGMAVLGALALVGCGSDSSISGVVPGDVFAGRTASVLITGDDTSWGADVELAFGDGVTVDQVVAASPTALWVDISVDAAAALGPRTVTVDGDDYVDAFSVVSPIRATVIGTPAQGSVITIQLVNLDFSTPFDTNEDNNEIVLPAGMAGTPGNIEPYTMTFTVATDVDAAPGAIDLSVNSGPTGATTPFTLPAAFEITAREAEVLTLGDITGSFAGAGDSKLFTIDPAGLAILKGNATTSVESTVVFYVLGTSGHFNDLIAVGAPGGFFGDGPSEASFVTSTPFYVIVSEANGVPDAIDFTVEMTAALVGDLTATETADPNNNQDSDAQAVTPPVTLACALADDEDEDWYTFDIAAADADKRLGVATFSEGTTDTLVDVFESDGTTSVLPDGELDAGYGEAGFTDPLPEGTYYVRIANTGGFFTPMPGPYSLALALTAAP